MKNIFKGSILKLEVPIKIYAKSPTFSKLKFVYNFIPEIFYKEDDPAYPTVIECSVGKGKAKIVPTDKMEILFDSTNNTLTVSTSLPKIVNHRKNVSVNISFCIGIDNFDRLIELGKIEGDFEFSKLDKDGNVIGYTLNGTINEPVKKYPYIVYSVPTTIIKKEDEEFLSVYLFNTASGEEIKYLYYILIITLPEYIDVPEPITNIRITTDYPGSANPIGAVMKFGNRIILNVPHTKETIDKTIYISFLTKTTDKINNEIPNNLFHVYGTASLYELYSQNTLASASNYNLQVNLIEPPVEEEITLSNYDIN